MSEQMRTKVIAGFLVTALIWAGLDYKSNDSKSTKEVPQTIQPIETKSIAVKNSSSFLDIEKYEKDSWGRSPFYLPTLVTVSKPQTITHQQSTLSWILSGIIINNSSPTAIINKRPVKIGETIDKALVTEIDKEKVIIKYNQKEITLTVSKG